MTALAGYWCLARSTESRRLAERMLEAQSIYGSRSSVRGGQGAIALGRRLFPLLPEDEFDKAPVTVAGEGLLVADLRLDNRSELCRDLGLGSGDARSVSDAEILGLALGRWQETAVQRLVGDFAFGWWDARRHRLVLARDFTGQRPLHYHRGQDHQGRGFFAFASMPKGLHALTCVPRSPDRLAAGDFLLHAPESGSESFFEGISKVPPGHFVLADRTGEQAHRYWHPPTQSLRPRSSADYVDGLRAHLDLAVAARLRGIDGQVASHLSGGLDSSAVTATAARLMASSHDRVIAYTSVPRAGFVSRRQGLVDEGPLAASVAELYPNIEHVRIHAKAGSPLDSLSRNAFLYERPYLNLCNGVWVDAIQDDMRRRGLRVLLTGSLGNAGFSFDGMPRLAELLGSGRLAALAREAAGLLKHGFRPETVGAAALGPFLPGSLWRVMNMVLGRTAHHGAGRAHLRNDPHLVVRAAARQVDWSYQPRRTVREAQLRLLRWVDFGNYNKGILGGWGIDVRDPSADRRLIEFCLSVPSEQFLDGGMPRALARRGLADRLPPGITNEFRKGLQGADWFEGLDAARGRLRDEIAAIARDRTAVALLDIERLQGLVADWPAPDMWEDDETTDRYRSTLLRAVSIGHFLRTATGTNCRGQDRRPS